MLMLFGPPLEVFSNISTKFFDDSLPLQLANRVWWREICTAEIVVKRSLACQTPSDRVKAMCWALLRLSVKSGIYRN
jgi:hypothetical protein